MLQLVTDFASLTTFKWLTDLLNTILIHQPKAPHVLTLSVAEEAIAAAQLSNTCKL